MRIGITGANGFIGNHLLRFVLARGHRPVAFLQRGFATPALDDVDPDAYEALLGDLLDPESLAGLARRCDAVFHLAGLNRYWARDPSDFHRVNVEGSIAIARACLAAGTGKLVHASSCITLGASRRPVPRNEDSPFNLGGLRFSYAESKKAAEDAIRRMARSEGLPAVIVQPASAIGERDHGPTPIGRPIAAICRGRFPLAAVSGGACFIDVLDLVRGLWLALEKGRDGETYLLAGENISNREFLTEVSRRAGRRPPRIEMPGLLLRGAGAVSETVADRLTRRDPPLTRAMAALAGRYVYYDGGKARRELGFEAGPIGPAIGRSVAWFQQDRSP